MKKTALTLLTIAFAAVSAFSQSVEDGIKFLYYQRTTSAIATLKKVVADKPKDAQAIYWLGQAYLDQESLDSAKSLYQQKLNEGVNDPWLWVGMGHVELLSGGDINAAKQKFEQAITATTPTKGKHKNEPDANILNAVGRANADGSSKTGDPQYGIDKLKQALDLDKTNPDIAINLGICYLKLGSDRGGEAVEAFREALTRNPNYALADYRIGFIYESQNNTESMNEWFGKAIAADPAFAPVYLEYFNYYAERDVNAAKEFLDKYVANADKDCKVDYFVGDYLFRAGKYQESLAQAKQMEAGACKSYKRLNILFAYDYLRLNDTTQAKTAIDKYFAIADTANVTSDDYKLASAIYRRFPGSEAQAAGFLVTAMDKDTVQKNKMNYADTIAYIYKKANMPEKRLEWLQKSYKLNPKPSNFDVYNLGDAALSAKNYTLADSMFTKYKTDYPDQPQGFIMLIKSAQMQDSTGAKAVQPTDDYIGYLMKDTVKNGPSIAYYHALQGGYYANTAKDLEKAFEEFKLAVQYDPSNAQYQQYFTILQKALEKKNNPRPAPAAKPKKSK